MISIGWLMCALLLGALAGLVVGALMGMAAREEERAVADEEAIQRLRVRSVNLEER